MASQAENGHTSTHAQTDELVKNIISLTAHKMCCTGIKISLPTTQQPLFYRHYTGQLALAGTSSEEMEDFVIAKFNCPHANADGSQRIWIREKTLQFSSAVLSTLVIIMHAINL